MLKNKALIITSKDDAHADYVIDKANGLELGNKLIRLNTEDFNQNCTISFKDGEFFVHIKDSDRYFSSSEVLSVWFRRPKDIDVQHSQTDVKQYIEIQSTASLRGLYFCTHDSAVWINPLTSLHRARIKIQQLQKALDLGFDVPQSIVSNSPNELISFFDRFKIVCTKSLDEPNFTINGVLYPMFTRIVQDKNELINNIDSLRICPVLLQEYIEKNSDIRVIVLGDRVFSIEIFSQDNELSIHDFRGVAPKFLRHSIHQLPSSLVKMIQDFVKQQGLYFSALDFVLSKDGQYFFLENNPNGQWLWLEGITGINISDCLLQDLLGSR